MWTKYQNALKCVSATDAFIAERKNKNQRYDGERKSETNTAEKVNQSLGQIEAHTYWMKNNNSRFHANLLYDLYQSYRESGSQLHTGQL